MVVDVRDDSITLLEMGYVRAYFFNDSCCVEAEDEGVGLDVGAELGGSSRVRCLLYIIVWFGVERWWRHTGFSNQLGSIHIFISIYCIFFPHQ